MTFYVKGLNELARGLRGIDRALPKELGRANKEVGGIVSAEATRRAPRGPHHPGVQPIASSVRPLAQARRVVIAAGGARTPHAGVKEYGGRIPRFHSRARTRVAARPYLHPAAEATHVQVLDRYQQTLDQLVRRHF